MKKVIPIYFVSILTVIFSSCSNQIEQGFEKEVKFLVAGPAVKDTVIKKEYIAEIQSLQNVEIRTHVKSFIDKIHVDEGAAVRSGQILFSLASKEFTENLLKANANYKTLIAELKLAEVELKNTKLLLDKNIVSKSELDIANARKEAIEAKIEEAASVISIAKVNLSYTQVRAPFDGVINRIPFKTGSLVMEGDLLTSISNDKEVFAYFNVSEQEFTELMSQNKIKQMAYVEFLMANNEIFQDKGRVETIENEINKSTGNIAFRARFKNPKRILKHGASGKILVKEDVKQAILIPQKSTFEIQDKIYIYMVDASGKIKARNIQPRTRLNNLYVVQEGIQPDEMFLYEGIQLVKDGDQIKFEKTRF